MTHHTAEKDPIGYCRECAVVVSRYHADNPGEFHPTSPGRRNV